MYGSKENQAVHELQSEVRLLLEQLREETSTDFVAISLYDPEQQEIRWRVAFGSLNDRYRAIAIRMGKGIAGEVLQTGRSMQVISFPADVPEDPLDYPIMVVEKLVSCYTVPIGSGHRIFGALMIASRKERMFETYDRKATEQAALRIEERYAPLYTSANIDRRAETAMTSPLEAYLRSKNRHSGMHAEAEILDQSIARLPVHLQMEITAWLERLTELLLMIGTDGRMRISIERRENNYMTLEVAAPGRLDQPHDKLSWLIERVGELAGNVEMYNEPGQFRLRVNLVVGILTEGKPWNF